MITSDATAVVSGRKKRSIFMNEKAKHFFSTVGLDAQQYISTHFKKAAPVVA